MTKPELLGSGAKGYGRRPCRADRPQLPITSAKRKWRLFFCGIPRAGRGEVHVAPLHFASGAVSADCQHGPPMILRLSL